MRFWWVNQNQTYEHEVGGGYMWSPKVNVNGAKNQFYDNMTLVEVGDVVFSFSDLYIKAVGIVESSVESAPKPTEFGKAGEYWNNEGWFVKTKFTEIEKPIKPAEYMNQLRPTLPSRYSPLQGNGRGNQGVYLALVPELMANAIGSLLKGQLESVLSKGHPVQDTFAEIQKDEQIIFSRPDIPETEKQQLVKARRGQGLFRSCVEMLEKGCRVSGVLDRQHLIASHIKPWKDSSDYERLDGNNGLLLAPHIDHLFDRGFISFEDDGTMLVSNKLDKDTLEKWGINQRLNYGKFNLIQQRYLFFHRTNRLII